MECDDKCDQAGAVWQIYRARICAFMADCRCSFDFDWVLEV
jgi:hypothetical protein